MKTLLTVIQRRIDKANMTRSADDPIVPLAHFELATTDRHGDPHSIRRATVGEIGDDFIEINSTLYDRAQIREIQPINF